MKRQRLHDPRTCARCRALRAAVARGEVLCSHGPKATSCELCLLGMLP